MKAFVFAFTRRGCGLAVRVRETLSASFGNGTEAVISTVPKFADEFGFFPLNVPIGEQTGKIFPEADLIVYVGACGIAVRSIAPFIRDKQTDPAVIAVDEAGTFVVPLLSGHIGGANRIARMLADSLCSTAVITTATDVNRLFSPDDWAARNGFVIGNLETAKQVSAAILECGAPPSPDDPTAGKGVPIYSDFPLPEELPDGLVPFVPSPLGIALTYRTASKFDETLDLVPKCLMLGIGCRRNTEASAIESLVFDTLRENGLSERALAGIASIDIKREESGLLEFARSKDQPIRFCSAAELAKVSGTFSGSEFVRSVTGVDNVCERAALLASGPGGSLLVRKRARDGITVAIALQSVDVKF